MSPPSLLTWRVLTPEEREMILARIMKERQRTSEASEPRERPRPRVVNRPPPVVAKAMAGLDRIQSREGFVESDPFDLGSTGPECSLPVRFRQEIQAFVTADSETVHTWHLECSNTFARRFRHCRSSRKAKWNDSIMARRPTGTSVSCGDPNPIRQVNRNEKIMKRNSE